MAAPLSFVVAEHDDRSRLDRCVVARLEAEGQAASRATVQRWIAEGRVTVDGATARASAVPALGARIDVRPAPPPPSGASADPSVVVAVVYRDDHLLVVDKPSGLVVHPAPGHAGGTLVNGLLALGDFDRDMVENGREEGRAERPGIVHRLDKGTSGLLVVARDERTREALQRQFAEHTIEREYAALVVGSAQDATYDTLHGRHPTDRLRFTTRVKRGRRAVTHVEVMERLGPATLVRCRLETGRTHQIRVHLAEVARNPVLGDPIYGKVPADPTLRHLAEGLGHQALHARVLGFVHPATGRAMRWESPLPSDVAAAIDALRATRSSISRGPST